MKIGFVPHQPIDKKQIAAGTRIRVLNIVKHLKDCVVSYEFEELKGCDVVIFQARWMSTDVKLAEKLKGCGIKLIFDTTDPHWDNVNFDPTGKKRKALDSILEYIDLMVFPTQALKETFLDYREDKNIEIVPDCIDLSSHRKVKKHIDKEKYTICWFGCRSNVYSVDLARYDLERLGKEFNLKLTAVYDTDRGIELEPFENLGIKILDWSDEVTIKAILESDVAINPKYDDWRRYKSSNKTIKALSLGVPCIERNFYKEIKKYLLSSNLRNKTYKENKKTVEKYSSVKIAKKLTDICERLTKKKTIKKKKIAVVTAITGEFDCLHEPEYYEDEVDYIAFVDRKYKSDIWQLRQIEYTHFKQARMTAKIFKILIHKYCDYDYTLWIDGSLMLAGSIVELVSEFLSKSDIALFKHRYRDCIYEEVKASFRNKKHAVGEPDSIRKSQIAKYELEGMPKKGGLYECTFILRRNNEKVRSFNEQWWSEISAYSSSDQVPFAYTLWKNPVVKVKIIKPGDAHKNRWAYYIEHKKEPIPEEVELVDLGEYKFEDNEEVYITYLGKLPYHYSKVGEFKPKQTIKVEGRHAKHLLESHPEDFKICKIQ